VRPLALLFAAALAGCSRGPEAAGTAQAELRSPDPKVRRAAVARLGHGKEDLPYLQKALQDSDREVRVRAAFQLAKLGWLGEEAIPALVDALASEAKEERWRAAQLLSSFRTRAAPAREALGRLLRDPVPEVRIQAAITLYFLDPRANEGLPVVLEALRSPDPLQAIDAAGILRAKEALPELRSRILGDARRAVVLAAADAMRRIEGSPEPAIAALDEALRANGAEVRANAAAALGNLGAAAAPALPNLLQAARDPEAAVRAAVAAALPRVARPGDAEVAAALDALARDPAAEVRAAANLALAQRPIAQGASK
jgi:HEAT repeat protein